MNCAPTGHLGSNELSGFNADALPLSGCLFFAHVRFIGSDGGMGRLLFLVVIAVVVYLLIKYFSKRISDNKVSSKAEDMVRCTYCGVHLPKGECIMADGNSYCSEAHRRAQAEKSQ